MFELIIAAWGIGGLIWIGNDAPWIWANKKPWQKCMHWVYAAGVIIMQIIYWSFGFWHP